MPLRALSFLFLIGSASVLTPSPAPAQCVYACDLRDGCFYCVDGQTQEECHVACRVCWGFYCGPEPKLAIRTELEPIAHLTTMPSELLEDKFERPVREILANVWSGFNGTPGRQNDRVLNIRGKILVEEVPHDFTLRIVQAHADQIYLLDIADHGRLDLTLTEHDESVRSRYSWARVDGPGAWDDFSFERTTPEARIVLRHGTH